MKPRNKIEQQPDEQQPDTESKHTDFQFQTFGQLCETRVSEVLNSAVGREENTTQKDLKSLQAANDILQARLTRIKISVNQTAINAFVKEVNKISDQVEDAKRNYQKKLDTSKTEDGITDTSNFSEHKGDYEQSWKKFLSDWPMSDENRKLVNKVIAAVPKASVSNKIAGFINFFQHQLRHEPEWTYELDGTTSLWRVKVFIFGEKEPIGVGVNKKKKDARSSAAEMGLENLNANGFKLVYEAIKKSGRLEPWSESEVAAAPKSSNLNPHAAEFKFADSEAENTYTSVMKKLPPTNSATIADVADQPSQVKNQLTVEDYLHEEIHVRDVRVHGIYSAKPALQKERSYGTSGKYTHKK